MKITSGHENGIKPIELQDAKGVAIIHRECFPHYFSTKLGLGFCTHLYRAYTETDGSFGFVIWRNGERVGFVVGGKSNIQAQINRALRKNAAVAMFMRPKLVFKMISNKLSKILQKTKTTTTIHIVPGEKTDKSCAAKLVLIGVKETVRGTGAATELMQAFCNEAMQGGFEIITLVVSRDNLRARAAYEKARWTLTDKGGESVEYYIDVTGKTKSAKITTA